MINPAVKDLAVRTWTCPNTACGRTWDRDINAAINLDPDETRIAVARAARLAERAEKAKKRLSQKARSAKSAVTKKANAEAKRLARHEEKMARAAGHTTKNLTVTPTDSKARRGPVRPKEMTAVVSAARVAQATPMARTVTPSDREEARTMQDEKRQMTASSVSLGVLDPPGEILYVSSM